MGVVAATLLFGALFPLTSAEAAPIGAAQSLTSVAVQDGYTMASAPSRVSNTERLVAGTLDGDRRVTYLMFRVSGVPAGATEVSARLTLTRDLHKLPGNVEVSAVSSTTWNEGTLNALNAPAVGTRLAVAAPAPTSATVVLAASTVRADGLYSFAVTSQTQNNVARFRSAESAFPGPSLTVTFTPPTSLDLMAGAAASGYSSTGAPLYDISLFNASNARVGPHAIRRSFDTRLPASFAQSAGRDDAANGYKSFVSWKPPNGDYVGAANGAYDAAVTTWARTVPAGTYATSYHEPENDMTGPQFVALQRHLYQVVKAANPGVLWGPIYMSYWWHVGSSHYIGDRAAWWPGSAYADFTAVDAYNLRPIALEREPGFRGWYDFMLDKGEPLLITEYGQYVIKPGGTADPALQSQRAQMIAQDAEWIRSQGVIKMWLLWDGVGAKGDWRLTDSASQQAWRSVAAAATLH